MIDFGKFVVLAITKTYAIRMAAVFMMSLATIWLKTGLMPRWLVAISYLVALALLIIGDLSMWVTMAFPAWVLVVSGLILARAVPLRGTARWPPLNSVRWQRRLTAMAAASTWCNSRLCSTRQSLQLL